MDERTPASRPRRGRSSKRKPRRGTDLRPDLPWLDKLEMPDLPITWTDRLIEYLVFYKDDPRGRSIMASWLEAQGRYRDMIVSHLRAAHLPEDLLYVSMIESSYDPGDFSSAGALGIWQFMPRGRQDLRPAPGPLGRRARAIRCARRSRRWITSMTCTSGSATGDMALAAFNAGYGAALRSIAKYNTNDYYQLCEYENGLPWETCLYSPKVLAAAIVGHNRAFFGFDKLKEDPPEQWDEVTVPTSMSLSIIARAAGTTEAAIKRPQPAAQPRSHPAGRGRLRRARARRCEGRLLAQARRAADRVGRLRRLRHRARRAVRGRRHDVRHLAVQAAQAQRRRSRESRSRAAPCSSCRRSPPSSARRTARRPRPSCSARASIRRTASR